MENKNLTLLFDHILMQKVLVHKLQDSIDFADRDLSPLIKTEAKAMRNRELKKLRRSIWELEIDLMEATDHVTD